MKLIEAAVCIGLQMLCSMAVAQSSIVVLGSSTAEGTGASPADSAWVNRLRLSLQKNTTDGIDTTVTNLAKGGYTSYKLMPTDYVPPSGKPTPDPERNVTKALSLHPDIIIINLPSNDAASGFTPKEYMDNLRFMFNTIRDAGVKAFITTTQPRNLAMAQRLDLLHLVDSIENNFGDFAINFWDTLVSADEQYVLRSDLDVGDGTHVNNLGHRYLFQQVVAANVFRSDVALPVSIHDFSAKVMKAQVLLHWQAEVSEVPVTFELQRRTGTENFVSIGVRPGVQTTANYSNEDLHPKNGQNNYRLKITESGRTTFSKIITANYKASMLIGDLYSTPTTLHVKISGERMKDATVSIINSSGQTLLNQKLTASSSPSSVALPIDNFPAGQYIFDVLSGVYHEAKSFSKF